MSTKNTVGAGIIALTAFNAAGAHGQTIIDFNGLGANPTVASPFFQDGIQLSSNSGEAFGVVGPESTPFNGSPSIFIETPGDSAQITREDGTAFNLTSIAVDNLLSNDPFFGTLVEPVSVNFNAITSEGASVTQEFTVDADAGFQTLVFNDSFSNVLSVDFSQGIGLASGFQFDDVTIDVIPEPASVVLLGLGGFALLGGRGKRGDQSGSAQAHDQDQVKLDQGATLG